MAIIDFLINYRNYNLFFENNTLKFKFALKKPIYQNLEKCKIFSMRHRICISRFLQFCNPM